MKKLILASSSPRRKELLEQVGFTFEIQPSSFEENMAQDLPPLELAKQLSLGKAQDIANKNSDSIVLGADTFIAFDNHILGKPHTPEKAKEILKLLSGKWHSVITGFTIIDTETKKKVSESVETKVYFRELIDSEIDEYIATGEPLDRAGAYAIQERGALLVDHIEGDYSNVVGLPITVVALALKDFDVKPE